MVVNCQPETEIQNYFEFLIASLIAMKNFAMQYQRWVLHDLGYADHAVISDLENTGLGKR